MKPPSTEIETVNAIAHLSFVDARRLELYGEALVDGNFEYEVDDVLQLGERLFVVAEIWVTHIAPDGKLVDELYGAPDGSTLAVFVTCQMDDES